MSNRYLVKCPQFGCGWSGLTAIDEAHPWADFQCTGAVVALQCPSCHHEWHGRVIGGRLKPMPLEDAEELELASWPPVEIGVGD